MFVPSSLGARLLPSNMVQGPFMYTVWHTDIVHEKLGHNQMRICGRNRDMIGDMDILWIVNGN